MNSEAFPKPSPAVPVLLEDWLGNTDRAEVGREAFFRGRDQEYKVFQNAVTRLMNGFVGGGTMIFQGAPGAGKTALMLECMEALRQHSTPDNPWVAVPIEATVLDSVADVIKIMILETNLEIKRLSEVFKSHKPDIMERLKKSGEKLVTTLENFNVTVNLGVVGITRQSKSSNFETSQDIRAETAFRDAASSFENFNLVIFVDEAQNTPVSNLSKSVMNCLHHGIKGISLIAAFLV
ncbi:MAG: DEAD/DEAH box helicase family protein [Gammaproteobacteria bacterium]|nr:DEAD/DEAH box helicase family protein [Gammaproteobacteria bacterium]